MKYQYDCGQSNPVVSTKVFLRTITLPTRKVLLPGQLDGCDGCRRPEPPELNGKAV
jgi:hypothetical protein